MEPLRRSFACVVSALFAVAPASQEPEPGADVTSLFTVADGLKVTLWSRSPQFHNPTAIDVDHRGRLWVTEAVDYRDFRNPPKDRMTRQGGERVMILEDTDGDGACDSSKVFVQDEDLFAPLGIAVIGDKIIVSASPHVVVYTDADGDDRPDKKEIFLTGFGGRNHDHGLHSFVAGPDGRWYFNAGNAGQHTVEDRSGHQIRAGSPYRDRGRKPNQGATDEGRAWIGGIVMRIDPDGRNLEVIAHNFRNNYEVALDSYGNMYQSDNDDDGNRSCRTLWVMEGGNYGYRSADGLRNWRADQRPGQSIPRAHWHQDDPGVCPPGTVNGAGGPTGVVVYEGGVPGLLGTVLNCDAGRNLVYGHTPVREGAGFALESSVFLAAKMTKENKMARWFRPSDVAVGTDGAIYVADWYDAGVGGHKMVDKLGVGRILRIEPTAGLSVPRLDVSTVPGAIAALASPAVNVRHLGRLRLLEMGEAALPALEAQLRTGDSRSRARAAWLLARIGGRGLVTVRGLLEDQDVEIRITALRALRQHGGDLLALLARCATDPSPAVRREVAVALREVPVERCREILLTLAAHDEGRFYLEALGLAFEGKEAAMYPALVNRLGDHALAWTDSFARLMWRLHPVAAVGAFEARAHAVSLSIEKRQEAVNALAFIANDSAAAAMRRIVEEGPEDLRPLAWFWLGHRTTNDWKGMADMGLQGVPSRTPLFTSGVMGRRSKKKDVDVDIAGARRLWLVVTDAGDGYSCDWADWIRPRLVGDGKTTLLTTLNWSSAETDWGQVRKNKAANGGPLMSRGKTIENGIGTHANSVIVYDLPRDHGFSRFQAEMVPDDGGTSQKGGTSIVFEVHAIGPSEREDLVRAKDRLLSGQLDEAARLEIGRQLAGDGDGGKLLLDLAKAGKLPAEVKEWVGPLLHRNPDMAVRLMANKEFPRPGTAKLPPIEEIMKIQGSAARGRKHFFADPGNCFACHSFHGEGASIGPDLTEIAKKFGPAELLDALVNPSGAIAFGYETWLLELAGGDAVSGFILAEGDILIIKDIAGQRRRIPADEVVSRRKLSDSIMPEAGAIGLTAQQLADLAAFLFEDDSERDVRDRR